MKKFVAAVLYVLAWMGSMDVIRWVVDLVFGEEWMPVDAADYIALLTVTVLAGAPLLFVAGYGASLVWKSDLTSR